MGYIYNNQHPEDVFLLLPLEYFSGHTSKLTIFHQCVSMDGSQGFWKPSFISFAYILKIEVVNGF